MQKVNIEFIKNCFKSLGITDDNEEMYLDFASKVEVHFARKHEIIKEDSMLWDYVGLVYKGLVRTFYTKNNKEVTESFMVEGAPFTAVVSMFTQKPCGLQIDAEDTAFSFNFFV